MDEPRQYDQLEPIYNSSAPIQDVALKTPREQWTIETGGKRGSGRSVLAARRDDDDDDMESKIYNTQQKNNEVIGETEMRRLIT